ncbi:MAG: hypothetical protein VX777_03285 [Chlamydiota bacterium]|nr:hypothetical protein [Chlamydiota bacterium]
MSKINLSDEILDEIVNSPELCNKLMKKGFSISHFLKDQDADTDLFTIKNLAKKHCSFLTENKIRWLIYKEPSGIEDCLVRVSNRIFVSEKKFLNFLLNYESNSQGNS